MSTVNCQLSTANCQLIVFDLDGTLYAKSRMVWRMLCSAPREWRLMLAERKTRKQLRGQWLGDENTFTTAMSDANNRKELYDGARANGLDLGDYDEYEKRLTQTSNNTIQATTPEPPKAEEVKPQSRVKMTFTTPNYNPYSFTSTTSKKQDVATPMMSEEISTADKEELTTFGEGVKQGVEGLEAGATLGDIMGDINKRRGRVLGMNPTDSGKTEIVADIPLSELFGYNTNLRSMTGGRGTYAYTFSRYEQAPSDVQEKEVAARAAKVAENVDEEQ